MPTLVDASIPLQTKAPDALGFMSQLATLGNLSNQFTAGQIANQSNQAILNEQNNLRALANDPSVHNSDGSINQDAYLQAAQRVAPTTGAAQATASANASSANQRQVMAHLDVGEKLYNEMSDQINGLLGDPRVSGHPRMDANGNAVVGPNGQPVVDPPSPKEALEALSETLPKMDALNIPKSQQLGLVGPAAAIANSNPAALKQYLLNGLKQRSGPQGTVAANTPILADTGGQKVNISSFANQGTQPASIPNTLPPGGQQSLTTDQAGNPAIINRDPRGNITGATGLPGSGGQGPQMTLPPGETPQSRDQLQQERNAVNQAAAQVPTQNFNSDQIIALAKDTKSGPGTSGFQRVASALGVPEATSYQQLGHFLALQQQSMGAAMGVHTNAGQELAGATSGTAEGMDGPALIKVAQVNKALANGLADFNKGMETAVTSSPQGVFAKRQFQRDWAQNFNPVNYELDEAARAGDVERANVLVNGDPKKGIPPMTTEQRQTLALQRKNTLWLTTTGHLPPPGQ